MNWVIGSSKISLHLLHYLAFYVYVDDTSDCFHLLFLSLSCDFLERVHLYKMINWWHFLRWISKKLWRMTFRCGTPSLSSCNCMVHTNYFLSWYWQRKSKIQFRRQWVAPECNRNFSEEIVSGRLFPTPHRPIWIKWLPCFLDSNIETEDTMSDTYISHFSGKTQIKTVEKSRY